MTAPPPTNPPPADRPPADPPAADRPPADPPAAAPAPTESRGRTASRLVLAAVMVGAGVLHFTAPRAYEPLIPPALGAARAWVYGSGVAEAVAGVLLALPRTRRVGAWAVAAVLVAVLPGNVQMALEPHPAGGLAANPVLAWLRVPLQVPLVLWALSHARRPPAARNPIKNGVSDIGP